MGASCISKVSLDVKTFEDGKIGLRGLLASRKFGWLDVKIFRNGKHD